MSGLTVSIVVCVRAGCSFEIMDEFTNAKDNPLAVHCRCGEVLTAIKSLSPNSETHVGLLPSI